MKLSRKTIYALALLCGIAKKGGETTALCEIAEKEGISLKYLEQIAGILCKAGLIKSRRGPNGGYRLARPAQSIKTGEVVRLTEGGISPDEDINAFEGFFKRFDKIVNDYFDSVSITDLVEDEKENNGVLDFII